MFAPEEQKLVSKKERKQLRTPFKADSMICETRSYPHISLPIDLTREPEGRAQDQGKREEDQRERVTRQLVKLGP